MSNKLDQDVCRICWDKHSAYGKKAGEIFDFWTMKAWWNDDLAYCPMALEPVVLGHKITEPPPEHCPFKMEHGVLRQSTIGKGNDDG